MNTQEILNLSLAIGFLIIVVCILYVTFYLVKALRSVINLTENLDETTQNIKEKLQMKALAVLPAILLGLLGRILKKRG